MRRLADSTDLLDQPALAGLLTACLLALQSLFWAELDFWTLSLLERGGKFPPWPRQIGSCPGPPGTAAVHARTRISTVRFGSQGCFQIPRARSVGAGR